MTQIRQLNFHILKCVNLIFSEAAVIISNMIANLLKQIPRETMKTGAMLGLATLACVNVFPTLRQWDVFAMFPSDAYKEREVRTLAFMSEYV